VDADCRQAAVRLIPAMLDDLQPDAVLLAGFGRNLPM
jgi:hypothetical protein